MKKPKSRAKSFFTGLKNLFGVGIYLLLAGVLLEAITIIVHQRLSFPILLPFWLQIALTLLCVLCCLSGMIWFNKTLNLIKIHLAGDENNLMTYGPFNYVRHPLYATLLVSLPPIVIIWFEDILFIVPWILIYIIAHYIILVEERGLIRIFGEEYKKYKQFVPGLFPYKGAGGVRFRERCEEVKMK